MHNIKIKFAYKSGFRRAWAVLSVIWLLAVILIKFDSHEPMYWILVAGVIPPVVVYVVGIALVWIIEGFAKPDQ
jgi:hypothetical protein